MKTVFFIAIAALCASAVHAQKVLNRNKQVVGYITAEGVVEDSTHKVLGYFKDDGSITNDQYVTMGYVKSDGSIVTINNKILGYYKNSIVYNGKNATLGSVDNNGVVYDSKGLEIAHLKGVDSDLGAIAIFFFFRLGGADYYNDPKMIRAAAKNR